MMDKNIFIVKYKDENAWTEVLMKFLANSNVKVLNSFFDLLNLGIKVSNMKDVDFEMQEVEEKSVPDATISSLKAKFIIHFEVKKGEGFNEPQAERHLEALSGREEKMKALVITTNDITEPVKFSRFVKKYSKLPVNIRFLSWADILNFVSKLSHEKTDGRVRFLAEQFKEFIEKEVKPMLNWSGFQETFCKKWEDYYRFREEHSKLVNKEIAGRIERQLKNMYPDYESLREIETRGENSIGWLLWSKRRSWIRIYAGIYGANDYVSSPYIYVDWYWSWDIVEKVKNKPKFLDIKKKLEAKNFFFGDNYIERRLFIAELCGFPVDNQRRKIFNFIDTTMETFHKSGFLQLLQK